MTERKVIEQIRKECTLPEKDGYIFRHESQCIWYEKAEATRQFTITFNYSIYNYIDVYGLRAGMRYNEIEHAIARNEDRAIKSSDTIHTYLKTDTLTQPVNAERLPTSDNYHFEISSEEGAISYARLINAFYSEQVLPFFKAYSTLTAINQWVATQPVENHKQIISTHNNAMVLRRIMIMYYARDPGYENLLKEYKAYLETKKNESPFGSIYLKLLETEAFIFSLKEGNNDLSLSSP